MAVLLIADHDNAALADSTAKALTAAKQLGGPVHVLVAGAGARGAADAAAALAGVDKVLLADAPHYAHALAEPLAALVLSLAGGYQAILAPASTTAKNLLPRVAAGLDAMQVSDVVAVHGPRTFEHPIYAGNVMETVEVLSGPVVATIRPTAFEATGTGNSAPVEALAPAADPGLSVFVGQQVAVSERPELGGAKTVVSGGRALGSKEQFDALILPLADAFGAAAGASRAAVDSGYAPNDWQVGQTGKVVAPQLYVAVGISGAIQHLAGMKDSKIIVAINKDEEAPIFQVADYGLVADLFAVLPELTQAVGTSRG